MLFGQWGAWKGGGHSYGGNVNMIKLAGLLRGDVDNSNSQNPLADSIEWGHFLRWWGPYQDFLDFAKLNLKKAKLDRIYKTWKFRNDFPHDAFMYLHRYGNTITRVQQHERCLHQGRKWGTRGVWRSLWYGQKKFAETLSRRVQFLTSPALKVFSFSEDEFCNSVKRLLVASVEYGCCILYLRKLNN